MDTPDIAGGGVDVLRLQIESGLRAAEAERRRRIGLMVAGAALAVSLIINVIVLLAPGSVGLASESQLDGVRSELRAEIAAAGTAQQAEAARLTAATREAVRDAARPDAASAALPVVCATLAELGDWSFTSGRAPAQRCPTTR